MSHECPKTNSKRSFLKFMTLSLGCVVGLASSWGIARFIFSGIGPKRDRELSLKIYNSLKHGEPYLIPQAEAWVIKGQNLSESVALDDRCTHLGCRYKWNQSKGLFECPCHGSEFDIRGLVLRGPATRSLPRLYLTETSNQMLRISEQRPPK